MAEPVALSGPQRIIRRIVAERRAGAPDEMIAKYAITEALHLFTRHDGPAADCTRCHDAMARAVHDVRDPGDITGASIVTPDPLNLPAYARGESVTWNRGHILVPLNRDGETVADLVLDEDAAGTLAAMLNDAAQPEGIIEFPNGITDEEMTRWAAAWDAAVGPERALTLNVGNRTATFRAKPWPPEYDADAVARETAKRTPHSEESTHVDQ